MTGINAHESIDSRTGLSENTDGKIDYTRSGSENSKTAEEVAKMVFQFVSTTTGLVNELEKGDDVQLVRLRTRKSEIVVVPGKP